MVSINQTSLRLIKRQRHKPKPLQSRESVDVYFYS